MIIIEAYMGLSLLVLSFGIVFHPFIMEYFKPKYYIGRAYYTGLFFVTTIKPESYTHQIVGPFPTREEAEKLKDLLNKEGKCTA